MIVVGGGPGTGKSTLAAGLAEELGASWLQSDAIRKELAGLPVAPLASAPGLDEGAYAPAASAAVYTEMVTRAEEAARMGRSSVLDASWARADARAPVRDAAASAGAVLVEIECRLDDAVADARIRARAEAGTSPSDATPEVAAALRARRDAWPEAIALDTAASPRDALEAARAIVTSRRPPTRRGADPGP
jgi:predicted kinase